MRSLRLTETPVFRRRAAPTILLVDPDAAGREIAALLMRYYGFEVSCACTFDEGLHLARTAQPDGIVTELLHDADGVRTIVEALRQDPATQTIPVVVLSASPQPDSAEREAGTGAAAYLSRPVNGYELRRTLFRLVGEPVPASAAPAL
jgi:CheY-like chemotaxis protein